MTDDKGPSAPGKYVFRLEYEVDVTDPLALAASNLTDGPDGPSGFGLELLSAHLMQAFAVRIATWDTENLGFKTAGGATALFTLERYARVNPAFAAAHPEITPDDTP